MALGTILGGLIGQQNAKDDYGRSEALRQQALQQFQDLYVPTREEQEIALNPYQYQGDFDPLRESAVDLGPSEYESINLDPATRDAQMAALAQMQEMASNPEATAMDRARMAGITADANRAAQGQRAAVMQNMRQRGLAGSGMELVAQMQANQGAAEQANREGMALQAQAQQRALDALYNSAGLAGDIRGQDTRQAENKAAAIDAINRFNAQNQQGVRGRNTDRMNQAGLRNLDSRQQMQNANTDLRNQQQTYNKGLYQTQFGNELVKKQGLSGQYGQMADYRQNKADRTVDQYAGYGRGFDKALETGANMYAKKG